MAQSVPSSGLPGGQFEPPVEACGDDAALGDLLRRAAAGDQAAWRRIVALYGRRVFALVKSRVARFDVAEEVTQSVFATVSLKLTDGGYSELGRFESWLFRVAINRVRDEIRRQRRAASATDPDVLDARPSRAGSLADDLTDADERDAELRRLRAAMHDLSDADRQVIELRHHANLPFARIAELLGEPLGTLLARHHRALKKLKAALQPPPASSTPRARENP